MYESYFDKLRDECYLRNCTQRTTEAYISSVTHFFFKQAFNGAQSAIHYLGRYTHRIAISNRRIISMDESAVTYSVKDYKNQGQWTTVTIPGETFIRKFLMHVLPKGFVRIRHYGLLSCRIKKSKKTLCRNLRGCRQYLSKLRGLNTEQLMKVLYDIDICKCPECGGHMIPVSHSRFHRRE